MEVFMARLTDIHLAINDEVVVIVDFELVATKKGYDFNVTKMLFGTEEGEFFLNSKDHNTQALYLSQTADAIDAYLDKHNESMLMAAADESFLQTLAAKNA
jgi:hypothetical protein